MANHINLPSDPKVAAKVVEAQAATDKAKLDRGWIGVLWGSKDHVPNNVAAVVVVVGFATIVGLVARASSFDNVRGSVEAISALVTLALGYLFGRSSKD